MGTMSKALGAPPRWTIPSVALAVLLLAVGAGVGQGQSSGAGSDAGPPAEYHLDDVEIEIDSRGCGHGLCASYLLTLRGTGEMTVARRDHTVEEGDAAGAVERAEFVEVLETVYREDFFRLAPDYRSSTGRQQVSDDGRVRYSAVLVTHQYDRTITIRIGDYSKSVQGYDGIPFVFLAVEQRILDVPGVEDWLEVAPRGRR